MIIYLIQQRTLPACLKLRFACSFDENNRAMSTSICLCKVNLWVGKSLFWITTSLIHLVAGHSVADALFKF